MFETLLLVVHVIGVIIWIGGVGFVTMVIFPMMYRTEGSLEKALLFQGMVLAPVSGGRGPGGTC